MAEWQVALTLARARSQQHNISANIYLFSFSSVCLAFSFAGASLHSFVHSFIFSPFILCVYFTLACLLVYLPVLQVRWMFPVFHAISYYLHLPFARSERFYCGLFVCTFFLHCTGLLFSHCVCAAVVLSYNHNLNAGKVFCLFPRFRSLCLRICV